MKYLTVRAYPSRLEPPKTEQLAWSIAAVAAERVPAAPQVIESVIDRVIDNACVAAAALCRLSVAVARGQALAHPRPGGATVLGVANDLLFHAEWAAWANTAAARELDMNDTFLAADYSHPSDTIPALIAVAQQCGKNGGELLHSIIVAYEIAIALAKGICLHRHKKDHIAHLGPAVAAGLGTLLNLDVETIYHTVQQAVHVSFTSRQSRRGAISSWKAFAPAHVSKLAIEATDYVLRGGRPPSPAYEGEDGAIAAMLGGSKDVYRVPLPEPGETRAGILESFAKEYAAEYHAQALIDLAFRVRERVPDPEEVETIILRVSRHAHLIIGSGSGDPHKYDSWASRETLDHSAMYIFAVALEDGFWHHEKSYLPERAQKPSTIRLWRKIVTKEDEEWTARYDRPKFTERSYGARAEIHLRDGQSVVEELPVADAHPYGRRPFRRADFVKKYYSLTEGIVGDDERERFLDLARRLPDLSAAELRSLNLQVSKDFLNIAPSSSTIF
jgi:2-methylcitrate dehydratase